MENVRLVRELPQNETIDWPPHSYPEFLQVELSSDFNLNEANTGPGLYTDADFCPLRNSNRLIAFEPIAADQHAVEGWRRGRQLTRDRRDGRYHYFVYVVPTSPARKLFNNSEDQIPAYDLRQQRRSICVRFFVPGYNIIASHSDPVEVPTDMIEKAFESKPQSSSS
jgi:hypothetical protein